MLNEIKKKAAVFLIALAMERDRRKDAKAHRDIGDTARRYGRREFF
jgi:hypothetical protein